LRVAQRDDAAPRGNDEGGVLMTERLTGPDAGPPYAWSPAGWPSERPSADPSACEVWCYTSQLSYSPGDQLDVHVSATAGSFDLVISRDGASAQLVYQREGLTAGAHPTP